MVTAIPISVMRCRACGRLGIPPQYICDACGGSEMDPAEIPGRGRVFSYTIIRVAPDAFAGQCPYTIVLVELESNLRITARVTSESEELIDVDRELIFERLDADTGYWFRVVS
jgi:uncharacterized OB-fold protein